MNFRDICSIMYALCIEQLLKRFFHSDFLKPLETQKLTSIIRNRGPANMVVLSPLQLLLIVSPRSELSN